MASDFNTIIALNVIEDRIALELTITEVFFWILFLLLESFDPVVFGIL